MQWYFIVAIIVVAVFLLWLLMIAPGIKNKKYIEKLKGYRFAHRGLHDEFALENSMSAFNNAALSGYGIELDVHMAKDGFLAVMHDDSLLRMCGEDAFIYDFTKEELLKNYLLGGKETIPFLEDIIDNFKSVPLLIELKPCSGNVDKLIENLFGILDKHEGEYFLQSFDPFILNKIKKYRKNAICGQLAGYINKSGNKISPVVDFVIRNLLINIISRPDFISYRFEDRNNFSFKFIKNVFRVPVLYWTIRKKENAQLSLKDGCGIIFENFKA